MFYKFRVSFRVSFRTPFMLIFKVKIQDIPKIPYITILFHLEIVCILKVKMLFPPSCNILKIVYIQKINAHREAFINSYHKSHVVAGHKRKKTKLKIWKQTVGKRQTLFLNTQLDITESNNISVVYFIAEISTKLTGIANIPGCRWKDCLVVN